MVGLAATVAACATFATSADARVVRAEGVLPPGQSGYVSLTGLLQGTGSPHLYDQQPLFVNWQRKSMLLDQPSLDEQRPRPGVVIRRDRYGVPSVTGATELDAWWGVGYAVAQDRLFQLEAFRHATKGRLAELTGKDALEDDLVSRRDYYTADERRAMLERLPAASRARAEAYRDGVNRWIQHVNLDLADPVGVLDLPAEYVATLTQVEPWTLDDSIAIGIFLGRTIPSGDGSELRNLRLLQQRGKQALEALVPLHQRGQLSTIPREEGRFPQGAELTPAQEREALDRSAELATTLPAASRAAAGAATAKNDLEAGRIGRVGGSSMFTVRKPGGGALLFNGPQLGFSAPELFVELEVHAPGLDLRGVTAPGLPIIGTGHNGNVAWGITSGLSDEDDLYAEKLVPGQPEKYWYKGQIRTMDCRDETFTYKEGVSALLDGRVPEFGTKKERICRTVHGPVQERQGNVAYARRYAIWGRETETLPAMEQVNRARDIHEVDQATRSLTWNENLMAADSKGNIGYWHPGLFQQRPAGYDQRLPLPGTGEAEWPGLVDRATLPRVINPKQGWLANWNNVPSQGWTTGDSVADERLTGRFHRVGWLMWLVRSLAKDPTWEGAERAIRQEGSVAQQRPLAGRRLRLAADGASGKAAKVLAVIRAWDGDYTRTDAAKTVDPGVAAWDAFKQQAAKQATAAIGGFAGFAERPSNTHQFDATNAQGYALRTLDADGYRRAAAAAHDVLVARFGSDDPARWREPRREIAVPAQGAMQAPRQPFFDRGTWEQLIELEP